jgi:predicted esterase
MQLHSPLLSPFSKPPLRPADAPQGLGVFLYGPGPAVVSSAQETPSLPPPASADSNLLLLLHGLGDDHRPYHRLAGQLRLPQTATLALRAPLELPLDCGWGWLQSLDPQTFDLLRPSPGDFRRLDSLAQTRRLLLGLLQTLQGPPYGWAPERIFLLGFSQGAVAAVDAALHSPSALGGVVGVGDSLPGEFLLPEPNAFRAALLRPEGLAQLQEGTPILLLHGQHDETVPLPQGRAKAALLRDLLGRVAEAKGGRAAEVEWAEFPKGHEMIGSPAEAQRLFEFLAPRLLLRPLEVESLPDVYAVAPQK